MHILDTSALMNAYPFSHAYTVPEVIEEVKDFETRRAVTNLIASRKLVLQEPYEEDVQKVAEAAKKTGDSLSKTDKRVLALAMVKNAIIVTDDYGIQNVAKTLKISFEPIGQKAIRRRYTWRHFCPGCRKFRATYICRTCGTRTHRRVASSRG